MKEQESSFVSVDKSNIIIETVKEAEEGDGVIVRLYECENSLTKTTLTFAKEVEEVIECNLMEEEEEKQIANGQTVTVTVKPYEVKTYKVKFQSNK